MSAFGTKKAGANKALQETFPDVAAAVRLETQSRPYGYVGRTQVIKADLPKADGLQADYHAEKKRWADLNAMNWVHNNQRTRWHMNHNTYGYTQPKPVLSQRVFANPSNGNVVDIYAARHDIGPLPARGGSEPVMYRGGILRTAQGQEYYQKLMKARIDQLNAIQSGVVQSADAPLNENSAYDPNPLGPVIPEASDHDKNELKDILEELRDWFGANRELSFLNRKAVTEMGDLVIEAANKLYYKVALSLNRYDFNDLLDYIEATIKLIDSMINARTEDALYSDIVKRVIKNYKDMKYFADGMFSVVDRPATEKQLKQMNLLRTMGKSTFIPTEETSTEPAVTPGSNAPTPTPAAPPAPAPGPPPPPAPAPGPPAGHETNLIPNVQPTGSGKKWIQEATKGMKKDAFTKQALQHKMTPEDFADHVLGHPKDFTVTTRRRAQFVKNVRHKGGAKIDMEAQNKSVTFDIDQRAKFGDRQGAYLGEEIGDQVPETPLPMPVEPDGTLAAPDSNYSRPSFPKFTVQHKPSNELKPRQEAPKPMFQDTASGIFSAPRIPLPVSKAPKKAPFAYTGGLTRKTLPKDREGFEKLAEQLKGQGKVIRINSGSQLKSIRANFIKHLGL